MSETIEKIGIPKTLKAKTAFLENKLQNIEDEIKEMKKIIQ